MSVMAKVISVEIESSSAISITIIEKLAGGLKHENNIEMQSSSGGEKLMKANIINEMKSKMAVNATALFEKSYVSK